MNILKKLAGILLLLFAGMLSLGTLMSLLNAITEIIKKSKESSVYTISYALGSLVGAAIIVVIIYFVSKLGLKLIKKKNIQVESIDEIGI